MLSCPGLLYCLIITGAGPNGELYIILQSLIVSVTRQSVCLLTVVHYCITGLLHLDKVHSFRSINAWNVHFIGKNSQN